MISRINYVRYAIGVTFLTLANFALAVDCSENFSPSSEPTNRLLAELSKTIGSLKAQNSSALSDGASSFALIRRFVSGEATSRGGDIVAEVPVANIGKNLIINYRKQKLDDVAFDQAFSSVSLSTIVRVRQAICGTARLCDSIYPRDKLVGFLGELIECNGGKNQVFEFDDAFLILDMRLIQNLPIGEGVIVRKRRGELKSLIIFQ